MNRIALTLALATLTLGSATLGAVAQQTPTPTFAVIDSDKSGEVSYTELRVVLPNISIQQFKDADADKSGGLNEQELSTIIAAGTGSLTNSAPANKAATPGTATN